MSFSNRILYSLPESVQKSYSAFKNKIKISKWTRKGKPVPVPHAIKQKMINEYQKKHNINIFIESGTYMGDMVWAQQDNFEQLYSVELSKEFVEQARKRFKKKKHIHIIQGDSGKIMFTLIKEIHEPALFWLDGHYSAGNTARGDKDCPIIEEVKAILSSGLEHVLLIDDARYFTGQRDYPTKEALTAFILNLYPQSEIHEENDLIIVELKKID